VVNYVSSTNETSTVQQQPEDERETTERFPQDHIPDSTESLKGGKKKKKIKRLERKDGEKMEEGTMNERERREEKREKK
jgi:hypothetical protein